MENFKNIDEQRFGIMKRFGQMEVMSGQNLLEPQKTYGTNIYLTISKSSEIRKF